MNIVRSAIKKAPIIFLPAAALVAGSPSLASEETSSSAPKVEALVRQVIDAYGGKTVLNKLRSLSARGVLESQLYERPAQYSLDLMLDRELRVEIHSGNSLELRILNGTKGYYRTADSPSDAVSGSRFLSMAHQFNEITMPYQLMTSSFTIKDGERSEVNGVPVRLLLLRDNEGPPMKLYIDAQSHRIVKDSGVFMMGDRETELSSEFHDFRKIAGRLFPFRIVNYAGGQLIGEIRINEYRVNPELPDSLFTTDTRVSSGS